MAPSFFFSYASVDRRFDPSKKIRRFFDDLNKAVYLFGGSEGFFDEQGPPGDVAPADSIAAGDDWKVKLRNALRTTRVLVPMCSPRYFMSKYCVWEWSTVSSAYDRAFAADPKTSAPILPIKWLTPGLTIQPPYDQFQFFRGLLPPRVEDVSQLMGSRKHRDAYDAYVRELATRLVDMIRRAPAADRIVGPTPDVDDVVTESSGSGAETGAQYVRCLFVAGLRSQIGAPRHFIDPYGDDPARKDWRPCYPSKDRIVSEIVEEVARAEGRVIRYLTLNPDVIEQIRDAERHNNIVVLVVDPWSLSIAEWRQFVNRFDQELLRNCAVVVVWNKEDPQTEQGQPLFTPAVRVGFDRHIRMTSTFFRESVMTLEEFQQALVTAFNNVRANLVSDGKASGIREGMTEAQPLVSI